MSSAREVIVRLLARREYSQHELRLRLRQRGFDEQESQQALTAALAAGWQSDERFAEAFVRSRLERGQGPLKIRAELRGRGIDDHLGERVMRRLAPDWSRIARAYLARHARLRDDWIKARQALQRRGFTQEQAARAVRALTTGADEDGDADE